MYISCSNIMTDPTVFWKVCKKCDYFMLAPKPYHSVLLCGWDSVSGMCVGTCVCVSHSLV